VYVHYIFVSVKDPSQEQQGALTLTLSQDAQIGDGRYNLLIFLQHGMLL